MSGRVGRGESNTHSSGFKTVGVAGSRVLGVAASHVGLPCCVGGSEAAIVSSCSGGSGNDSALSVCSGVVRVEVAVSLAGLSCFFGGSISAIGSSCSGGNGADSVVIVYSGIGRAEFPEEESLALFVVSFSAVWVRSSVGVCIILFLFPLRLPRTVILLLLLGVGGVGEISSVIPTIVDSGIFEGSG